jgi:hypothetical protein
MSFIPILFCACVCCSQIKSVSCRIHCRFGRRHPESRPWYRFRALITVARRFNFPVCSSVEFISLVSLLLVAKGRGQFSCSEQSTPDWIFPPVTRTAPPGIFSVPLTRAARRNFSHAEICHPGRRPQFSASPLSDLTSSLVLVVRCSEAPWFCSIFSLMTCFSTYGARAGQRLRSLVFSGAEFFSPGFQFRSRLQFSFPALIL